MSGYGGAVIVFSGAALDRAAALRRRPEWLEARRADPRARSVLMSERGRAGSTAGGSLLEPPSADAVFLGLRTARRCSRTTSATPSRRAGSPAGLREAATELPAGRGRARRVRRLAARVAPAPPVLRQLRRADRAARRRPRARLPACGAHHFPRTDPVVIVRVTDGGDGLLLGRQARWPEGRFSLLAGYVEPGETLEEAVRREVLEESGVAVDSVSYVASQPWPFPSSLMLGFSALAARGDPAPGDDELAEVRWFERAEVERAARGEGPLVLAPPYSIARRLIDAWLAGALAVRAVRIDVVDRGERRVRAPFAAASIASAPPARRSSTLTTPAISKPSSRMPLDRLDRGAAGGHDVLDDEAALARLELRALDPALEAVLLLVLAHEERLDGRARGQRGARDRVGAHSDPAHGGRAHALRLGRHQLAERAEAVRQQDRPLGVDVVLRRLAARERHLADDERVLAQLGYQAVAGGFSHVCRSRTKRSGSADGGR